MTEALQSEWVILTDENVAIRFARHDHHIDFRVFEASLTTYYENGQAGEPHWELNNCGDSWTLDQWEDAFWDIDGGIKWDGCINWQTNPECMIHGCGPSHAAQIGSIFNTIYAYAKRHFDLLGDEAPPMPSPALELAA